LEAEKLEYEEFPRVCEHCGEENPSEFPVCWNCHEDLPASDPEAARPLEEAATKDPSSSPAAGGLPLWIAVELGVVLALLWLPAVLWGLEYYGLPPAEFSLWVDVHDAVWSSATVLLLGYLLWREGGWLEHLGIRGLRIGRELALGVVLAAVSLAIWPVVHPLAERLGLPYGERPMFPEVPQDLLPHLLRVVALLICAAEEEVLFRVYLWRRLEQVCRDPILALLASSLLFALWHAASPAESLSLFVFGLLYGWIFLRTRRLGRLVFGHWLCNVAILYLY
jgi:membrane protease YdiL (CAAX protease family)